MVDDLLTGDKSLDELLTEIERSVLAVLLERMENNQSEIARHLKIPRSTLRSRLKKHGLGG